MNDKNKLIIYFFILLFFIFLIFLTGNLVSNFYFNQKISLFTTVNLKWNFSIIFLFLIIHLCFLYIINDLHPYSKFIALFSELPSLLIFTFRLPLWYKDFFSQSNPLGFTKYMLGLIIISSLFLKLILLVYYIFKRIELLSPKKILKIISLFALLFFIITSLWTSLYGSHGDEWLYILSAQTTLFDFDLNAANNFPLKFHRKDGTLVIYGKPGEPDYRVYTRYTPALGILVSPLFYFFQFIKDTEIIKLFSSFGPGYYTLAYNIAVRMTTGIYTVIALLFFFRIFYLFSNNKKLSTFFTFLSFFSVPVVIYANQAYAQNILLLITLYTFYIIIKINRSHEIKTYQYIITSVMLSLIFWLNFKLLIITISILIIFIYEFFKRKNYNFLLPVIFCIISFLLFFLYNFMLYNEIMPLYVYYGSYKIADQSIQLVSIAGFFKRLLAVIFDQEKGFFIFFPIFMFLPSALFLNIKNKNKIILKLLFIFIPYYFLLTLQNYSDWRAAASPPLRYFVFSIPLLCLIFANHLKFRYSYFIFLAYSLIFSFTGIFLKKFINSSTGKNFLFDTINYLEPPSLHLNIGHTLSCFFPDYFHFSGYSLFLTAVYILVIIFINIFYFRKIVTD